MAEIKPVDIIIITLGTRAANCKFPLIGSVNKLATALSTPGLNVIAHAENDSAQNINSVASVTDTG